MSDFWLAELREPMSMTATMIMMKITKPARIWYSVLRKSTAPLWILAARSFIFSCLTSMPSIWQLKMIMTMSARMEHPIAGIVAM